MKYKLLQASLLAIISFAFAAPVVSAQSQEPTSVDIYIWTEGAHVDYVYPVSLQGASITSIQYNQSGVSWMVVTVSVPPGTSTFSVDLILLVDGYGLTGYALTSGKAVWYDYFGVQHEMTYDYMQSHTFSTGTREYKGTFTLN